MTATPNTAAPTEIDDILGHCEQCSDPIRVGYTATYSGGDDCCWFCEKHSPTLKDQCAWVREVLADGTWADLDFWNDEVELRNYLDKLETEYLTTGDRTMATVQS